LQDLMQWFVANDARTPGTVFFSYAWPAAGFPEYSWFKGFLVNVKQDLELVGVNSYLDEENPYADSSINDYMRVKLEEAEFVLLFGMPDLRAKHEGSVRAVQSELPVIARKRQVSKDRGERSPVIPISLVQDFRDAFPPEYDKYTNVREWASQDYFLNIKNLIDYIYDVLGVKAYENKWNAFFKKLKDEHGYVLRGPEIKPPRRRPLQR